MNLPDSFKLFSGSPKEQVSQMILTGSSMQFISLIEALCIQLLFLVHPKSPSYLDPNYQFDTPGESGDFTHFAKTLQAFLPKVQSGPGSAASMVSPEFNGSAFYYRIWQLELLIEYSRIRNEMPDFLVAETSASKPLLYETLCKAHEWRASDLKRVIRENGPDFGSVTGWHTIYFTEHVKDWPQRFSFEQAKITPLPRDSMAPYEPYVREWKRNQRRVEKTNLYPNDRNAVSIHQTWVAATKEELMEEFIDQASTYPPAGYGTRLENVRQAPPSDEKYAGWWAADFYRSLTSD